MALTVSDIITNLNSYISDASTDRITAAERLQYVTEAVIWLQESLQNDAQNATYTIPYFETVHYYKITDSVADLLDGADLRQPELDQKLTFARKSSREMAEEIGQNFREPSWAIERRDGDSYLVINHKTKYNPLTVSDCDGITSGGGTWEVDATNTDATNLTVDVNEYKQGSGSFNFDIDVSQSGNNKAGIYNSSLDAIDMTDMEQLASFIMWVYIPDVTYTSSVTIYWGSSTSAYWSNTATTDTNGNAFVNGWNRISIPWDGSTTTGSPDVTAITYFKIEINYGSSQGDDTDYRIDDIIVVRPENLTFFYLSWNVGQDTNGADITKFGATTDVPYFSGQYDQYKYAVAHKAASLVFNTFRLYNESTQELQEAMRSLQKQRGIMPSQKNPEVKSFKVRGVNLTRHRRNYNKYS